MIDVVTMQSLGHIDKTDKSSSRLEFSENRHHIKDIAVAGDSFYLLGDTAKDIVGGYTAALGVEKFDVVDHSSQGSKKAIYPSWIADESTGFLG